jgi:hypothetical protein
VNDIGRRVIAGLGEPATRKLKVEVSVDAISATLPK